jgi:hypothetical protein
MKYGAEVDSSITSFILSFVKIRDVFWSTFMRMHTAWWFNKLHFYFKKWAGENNNMKL